MMMHLNPTDVQALAYTTLAGEDFRSKRATARALLSGCFSARRQLEHKSAQVSASLTGISVLLVFGLAKQHSRLDSRQPHQLVATRTAAMIEFVVHGVVQTAEMRFEWRDATALRHLVLGKGCSTRLQGGQGSASEGPLNGRD